MIIVTLLYGFFVSLSFEDDFTLFSQLFCGSDFLACVFKKLAAMSSACFLISLKLKTPIDAHKLERKKMFLNSIKIIKLLKETET